MAAAPPSPPTRPPPPLVEALLQAAELEVTEHGADGVSLRAIARRAGVSHQAPGHHFGDRRGLLTALATRGYRTLGEQLEAAEQAAGPTSLDRLAGIGVGYVAFAADRPALFTVMFRPTEHRADDAELLDARVAAVGVLQRCVAAAHGDGWGAGHDEQALAITCWALVHGTVQLWRDGTLAGFFDEHDVAAVADHVTGALIGLLASPS